MTRLLSGLSNDDTATLAVPREDLADAAWAALIGDSNQGICVLAASGSLRAANEPWLRVVGREPGLPMPTTLSEALPEAIANDIERLASDAIGAGSARSTQAVLNGVLFTVTARPVQSGEGVPAVLATWHREAGLVSAPRFEDPETSIDNLTARERDVLRLIGYGLSTADIAKVLHRSVKTIEWHRVALGNKLGVTNRVELARIAIREGIAGLDPLPEGVPDDEGTNGTNGTGPNGSNGHVSSN